MDSSHLRDWAFHYFRSRDAFTKSILSISQEADSLLITHKDRKEMIIAAPELSTLEEEKVREASAIVTNDTPKNVDALAERWKLFSAASRRVYFINPGGQKWVINPLAHARVCDEKTLRDGLHALARGDSAVQSQG